MPGASAEVVAIRTRAVVYLGVIGFVTLVTIFVIGPALMPWLWTLPVGVFVVGAFFVTHRQRTAEARAGSEVSGSPKS